MSEIRVGEGCYSVSSDYLVTLSELAFERGLSLAGLLEGSGIPARVVLQSDIAIGHEAFLRVVDNFIDYDHDLWTAIECGRRMTLSKHGYVGYAAQHSKTLEEAGIKVHRYVSTRVQLFELLRGDDPVEARLLLRPQVAESPALRFLCLAFLVCLETIGRQILGPQAKAFASTIALRGEAPPTPAPALPAGSRILFNQAEYGFSWPRQVIELPVPTRDDELARIADAQCENALSRLSRLQGIAPRVRQQLRITDGVMPHIDEVAARLNLSVATLKRRLKLEGTSFQQLKDEERYKLAAHLLRDSDTSIDRIADQLGYSDASNFAKAFRNWSGRSPGKFREQA